MAGSRLPCVLVNVMRGGPGLGSIGAAQGDYLQATKGHGHGDYHVPVLAPSSIGEAIELVGDAFVLAERYRTPVMILADGILGQAMEPVRPDFPTLARQAPGLDASRAPRAASPARSGRSTCGPRTSSGTTWTCRRSTPRSPRASRAGRASTSTTPRSCSSPTARPPGWRERPSSGRASRASRPGLFRPITLWPFPAAALREAAGRRARGPGRGDLRGPARGGRPPHARGDRPGHPPRPHGRHGPQPGRGRGRPPGAPGRARGQPCPSGPTREHRGGER